MLTESPFFAAERKNMESGSMVEKYLFEPSLDSTLISEKEIFSQLQRRFSKQFEKLFPGRLVSKTIVVVPSLTLDQELLRKLPGHIFYEERLLCLLMLLRMPMTKIIFLTSVPIDNVIVDYYLHLLPGITGYHARQRLVMLSCYDASSKSLTEKILERPRLIKKIKQNIGDPHSAHIACFNVTEFERKLAVQLGVPLYGTDPELLYLGTKSGSRKIFKACGIPVAEGCEDLRNRPDVINALIVLKKKNPSLRKAVIKIDDGFGGEGNAVFTYYKNLDDNFSIEKIDEALHHRLKIVAKELNEKVYFEKFYKIGGIVEAFIEGTVKTSPSVQCRINPLGESEIVSTHDQFLDGEEQQVFLGASFPASSKYNIPIAQSARIISEALAKHGVMGRFSIDFISVKKNNKWKNYAVEINLRKGGTTHPFLMLQYLTDGEYIADKGEYITANGNKRFYFASDNVGHIRYKGLTPYDLIEIAMVHSLMYDGTTQEGVMFHLMGALSQYGKFGVVCIGSTHKKAGEYYERVIKALDKECKS